MRKRVVREFGTIFGVVVILALVVFANAQWRRTGKVEQYDELRKRVEANRKMQGKPPVDWGLLRKTEGTLRSGPTFHRDLRPLEDTVIDIIGFMVPLFEFYQMKEFLLLPLPIQCYFCQAPPMREVIWVHMEEGQTAQYVEEPVLVNGMLALNEGPNTKFFYEITDAAWGPGTRGGRLTRKQVPLEHKLHAQQALKEQEGKVEELLEPIEPPTGEAEPSPAE